MYSLVCADHIVLDVAQTIGRDHELGQSRSMLATGWQKSTEPCRAVAA